jgi:outer membrane protein TolC
VRFYSLLIVLMSLVHQPITGQNKLILSEAISLAVENNFGLQKQFAEVKKSELELDLSGRLPNPVLSYSREDLKDNSISYSEWVASGSIPINFLWDRWSDIESKEKSLEAQRLFFLQAKTGLVSIVSSKYAAHTVHQKLSDQLGSAYSKLNELAEISRHKLNEGDISEYELHRILIELNKLKTVIAELETDKRANENELKMLIGYSIETSIQTEKPHLSTDIGLTKEELTSIAIQRRNDLSATEYLFESEKSSLTYNSLKAIPNISLTAGYKEQDINFKGTVLQVDFEIPLFNRNQQKIQQSEIQLGLLEKEKIFLTEKIKTEVSEAYDKYELVRNLFLEQSAFDYENLFNIVTYSYELGEISLMELIDGINTYVEGVMLRSRLETSLYKSNYELEQYTASSLNIENK